MDRTSKPASRTQRCRAFAVLSAAGASHGHLSVRRIRVTAGIVFGKALA